MESHELDAEPQKPVAGKTHRVILFVKSRTITIFTYLYNFKVAACVIKVIHKTKVKFRIVIACTVRERAGNTASHGACGHLLLEVGGRCMGGHYSLFTATYSFKNRNPITSLSYLKPSNGSPLRCEQITKP